MSDHPIKAPPEADRVEQAVNLSAALARVGGKVEHLRKIVTVFLAEAAKLLSEMRQAITSGDAPTLKRAAHSLKGSVGIFGAASAVQAAQQLETMAADGEWAEVEEAYTKLAQEMDRLLPALSSFLNSAPSPSQSTPAADTK